MASACGGTVKATSDTQGREHELIGQQDTSRVPRCVWGVYVFVVILRFDALQQPVLNPIKHRIVVNDSQVLCLSLELLVRVLAGGEHLRLGPHLAHLRGHLVRSYTYRSAKERKERAWREEERSGLPLSFPSKKLKTDCRPKMQRKYQLMLDIHLGSMSFVMTPDCSMLLNLIVIGKGSFTGDDVSRARPPLRRELSTH